MRPIGRDPGLGRAPDERSAPDPIGGRLAPVEEPAGRVDGDIERVDVRDDIGEVLVHAADVCGSDSSGGRGCVVQALGARIQGDRGRVRVGCIHADAGDDAGLVRAVGVNPDDEHRPPTCVVDAGWRHRVVDGERPEVLAAERERERGLVGAVECGADDGARVAVDPVDALWRPVAGDQGGSGAVSEAAGGDQRRLECAGRRVRCPDGSCGAVDPIHRSVSHRQIAGLLLPQRPLDDAVIEARVEHLPNSVCARRPDCEQEEPHPFARRVVDRQERPVDGGLHRSGGVVVSDDASGVVVPRIAEEVEHGVERGGAGRDGG